MKIEKFFIDLLNEVDSTDINYTYVPSSSTTKTNDDLNYNEMYKNLINILDQIIDNEGLKSLFISLIHKIFDDDKSFFTILFDKVYSTLIDYEENMEDENVEDEDIDESYNVKNNILIEMNVLKKRIDPKERKKHQLYYKKNKAKIKAKVKKYRNSSKFKKYLQRKKTMSKMGKTATGKKMTHFI